MTTYKDKRKAETRMERENHSRQLAGSLKAKNMTVIVEGPESGEWTLMSMPEAQESGFTYSWLV